MKRVEGYKFYKKKIKSLNANRRQTKQTALYSLKFNNMNFVFTTPHACYHDLTHLLSESHSYKSKYKIYRIITLKA